MPEKSTGIGGRLAKARRFLAVVLDEDMPRSRAAELLGVSAPTWTRWEKEDDRPSRDNVLTFARLCQDSGLVGVTAAWLEYGEGEGPQIGTAKRGHREGLRGERLPHPSSLKKKRRAG